MTKDEILEYFKDINHAYNDCTRHDTLKRMLDELEQEPCDDAISRQNATAQCFQAMELISGEFECELSSEQKSYNAGLRKAIEIIRAMPPVTPAEKVGHWRHYENMLTCSECGAEYYDGIMEYCGDDVPKCCPDCGSRMMQEVEE